MNIKAIIRRVFCHHHWERMITIPGHIDVCRKCGAARRWGGEKVMNKENTVAATKPLKRRPYHQAIN
jgi:hypothetical protein